MVKIPEYLKGINCKGPKVPVSRSQIGTGRSLIQPETANYARFLQIYINTLRVTQTIYIAPDFDSVG